MSPFRAAWAGTWALANGIIFVWGLLPPRVPWVVSLLALLGTALCGLTFYGEARKFR